MAVAAPGIPMPMITAAPQFQPVYGRSVGFNKRQDFTFTTCGLDCADGDFCQGYRTDHGFCCPSSVLTRTEFNYCGPATTCIEWSTDTSTQDFFFDSTRSAQLCGRARPSCATYIYTNDDYTQIFCASDQSGVYTFATTQSRGFSATFLDPDSSTTSTEEETTSPTTGPSASVIGGSRTSSQSQTTSTGNPDQTGEPNNDDDGGLSTGAVAGIGVGAALAGIAMAIGGFFLWRRNKKKPSGGDAGFPPAPPMAGGNSQFNGQSPNEGYYQQHQPYATVPQNNQDEYFKGAYPQQMQGQGNTVYEIGGGGVFGGQVSPPAQIDGTPISKQNPQGFQSQTPVSAASPYGGPTSNQDRPYEMQG